jgi:hypothetical protein
MPDHVTSQLLTTTTRLQQTRFCAERRKFSVRHFEIDATQNQAVFETGAFLNLSHTAHKDHNRLWPYNLYIAIGWDMVRKRACPEYDLTSCTRCVDEKGRSIDTKPGTQETH